MTRHRQGQANHFNRYVKDPNPYALERYQTEVKRLYGVLDKHLASTKSSYLVGEKCTIADIAHWGIVRTPPILRKPSRNRNADTSYGQTLSRWAGIELDEFPTLKAWEERMFARPAVEKGRQVPQKHQREMLQGTLHDHVVFGSITCS